jgi:hypothetical protein
MKERRINIMNKYETLEMEIIEFDSMDVITASACQYDMGED